jgi:hypothetical protein
MCETKDYSHYLELMRRYTQQWHDNMWTALKTLDDSTSISISYFVWSFEAGYCKWLKSHMRKALKKEGKIISYGLHYVCFLRILWLKIIPIFIRQKFLRPVGKTKKRDREIQNERTTAEERSRKMEQRQRKRMRNMGEKYKIIHIFRTMEHYMMRSVVLTAVKTRQYLRSKCCWYLHTWKSTQRYNAEQ